MSKIIEHSDALLSDEREWESIVMGIRPGASPQGASTAATESTTWNNTDGYGGAFSSPGLSTSERTDEKKSIRNREDM